MSNYYEPLNYITLQVRLLQSVKNNYFEDGENFDGSVSL